MDINITLKDKILIGLFISNIDLSNCTVYDAIIIKTIVEALRVTAEDIEKYNIRETDGLTTWDNEKPFNMTYKFSDRQLEVLKTVLQGSQMGQISINQIPNFITQLNIWQ